MGSIRKFGLKCVAANLVKNLVKNLATNLATNLAARVCETLSAGVLSAILFLPMLVGCGKSPVINLHSPAANLPGVPSLKPGSGNGTPNENGANGVQPIGGARLVCVDDSVKEAFTLSTFASGTDAGKSIVMIEKNGSDATSGELTNVGNVTAPHLASVLGADRARILFMGQSIKNDKLSGNLKLYAGDYSLTSGVANVTAIGAAGGMSPAAQALVNSLGLAARNYGSSSRGHYLIVPGQGGLHVLDAFSLKDLGGLGLNSLTAFWPTIDEDTNTLSVVVSSGDKLQVQIFRLKLGSNVTLSNKLTSGSAGRISLSPIADGQGGYFWSEAGSVVSSSLTLVHYRADGSMERAVFNPPISGARVFPQVAVLKVGEENQVAVAFENVSGGGLAGYDVSAGISAVRMTAGRAVIVTQANYQPDVLIYMQNSGWAGRPMNISSLVSSYDRSTVVLQARTRTGNDVFQFDGSVMFQISAYTCSQMDILSLAN